MEYFSTSNWITLILIGISTLSKANRPPQWLDYKSSIIVPENASVGEVILQMNITDADNDAVTVAMDVDGYDDLLEVITVDGERNLWEVILRQPLDREKVEQYSILFTFSDGATPVSRWSMLFVWDVNDNAPEFINEPYFAFALESAPVGSSIFQVSASDADAGVYGLFTYTLKTETGYFAIDQKTGVLRLAAKLDPALGREYNLILTATDGGGLNGTTRIHITLVDGRNTSIGIQHLTCYNCSATEDCAKEQLPCAATTICALNQYCVTEGVRVAPNDYTYTRGCREISTCMARQQEHCTRNEHEHLVCHVCCDQDLCNAWKVQQHLEEDAKETLGITDKSQASPAETAGLLIAILIIATAFNCLLKKV